MFGTRNIRIGLRLGARIGLVDDSAAAPPATTTLTINNTDAPDPVMGGKSVVNTVQVTNVGAIDATLLVVTITLDASLTFVSSSGTGWSLSRVGQVVTATLATLAVGAANPIVVTSTTTNTTASITTTSSVASSNASTVNSNASTQVNAVALDATSGKYTPTTSAEWATVMLAAGVTATVASGWAMQEPSGSLADSIGSVTLTASGAGHLYQQPVTGWSRLAVKCVDATAGQKWINSTTAPNPSTTDVILGAYLSIPAGSPAVVRDVMGHASSADCRFNTTGKLRVVFGASADLAQDPRGRVMPVLLKIDNTGTISALYTDQEKFIGTYVLPPNAALVFFGGQTAAASGTAYLLGFSLTGASARLSDAQIKSILLVLNWSIPWS